MFSAQKDYLDDLLKGQSTAEHHGSLRRDHLLIDGVVEMSHLLNTQIHLYSQHKSTYNTIFDLRIQYGGS